MITEVELPQDHCDHWPDHANTIHSFGMRCCELIAKNQALAMRLKQAETLIVEHHSATAIAEAAEQNVGDCCSVCVRHGYWKQVLPPVGAAGT